MELADPEAYDPKYKEWKMEDLPMMPEPFKLEVIRQTTKQYQAVKAQIHRKDVGEIIIATDAGREGELVARLILKKAGSVAFADDVGLLSGIDSIGVTVVAVVELLYSAS